MKTLLRISRMFMLFSLALILSGQRQAPVTVADITGDGVVHQIAAAGSATWLQFQAPPGNSSASCGSSSLAGCVRIGDANISTSRGIFLLPGAYASEAAANLNEWYYLVQTGDKLVITYGK